MLVLASGSVGRRALLANAGVPHDVMPAPIDEDAAKASLRARGLGPGNVAKALAELKALDVSARRPEDLVLGCDQTLAPCRRCQLDHARPVRCVHRGLS